MKNKLLYLLSAVLILTACKPKLDVPDPEKGSVDASRFVAIGGSMTAGYADIRLLTSWQSN